MEQKDGERERDRKDVCACVCEYYDNDREGDEGELHQLEKTCWGRYRSLKKILSGRYGLSIQGYNRLPLDRKGSVVAVMTSSSLLRDKGEIRGIQSCRPLP